MNNQKSRYFSCGIINLLSWSDLELQISNHHDHLTFILLDKVKCRLILFQLDVKCTSWYINFVNFRFLINQNHALLFKGPYDVVSFSQSDYNKLVNIQTFYMTASYELWIAFNHGRHCILIILPNVCLQQVVQ